MIIWHQCTIRPKAQIENLYTILCDHIMVPFVCISGLKIKRLSITQVSIKTEFTQYVHTESSCQFLSNFEWILMTWSFVYKTFDILAKIQWKSNLGLAFWVFKPVFRNCWSKVNLFHQLSMQIQGFQLYSL